MSTSIDDEENHDSYRSFSIAGDNFSTSRKQVALNSLIAPPTEEFFPQKKSKGKSSIMKKGPNKKGTTKAHQLPPMQNVANPSSVSSWQLSGSEAEFLTRQLHQTSSLPLIPYHGISEDSSGLPVKSRSAGGSDEVESLSSMRIIESLKERLSFLEKQLSSAQQSLQNKEQELEKKDAKLKAMIAEGENLRKDHNNELKKLRSEHELEVFRITEKFSKEKLLLLSNSSSYIPENDANKEMTGEILSKPLLLQLEQLRAELRMSQENSSEEKRTLLASVTLQQSIQDNKFKSEIIDLKMKNGKLEETIQALKDQEHLYILEIKQCQNKNEILLNEYQESKQEQIRLRNELKNMQQSIQATYRFDSSMVEASPSKASLSPSHKAPSNNLPNDIETAMKLQEAKYEAKLRQMQNKLDFLKSQVETERKELDDTKILLSSAMNERDKLLQNHEKKILNLQREHEQRLQQHEEKIIANYEKRMIELTNLQKQFAVITNQSSELQHQNTLINQQVEASQGTISRLQLQILNHQTEIEEYKRIIAQFEQDKTQDMMKENQKVSQETLIKRLDNERNYLKSQLKSEIVLKNELQVMLDESNRLLRESQNQWNKDVEKLQNDAQSMQQSAQRKEAQLTLELKQLEQEKITIHHQMTDLKEGFQKCRDQLKMEQHALEQMTSARDQAQQRIQILDQELQLEKSQLESTHQHYQKQIEAVQSLLTTNEEKFNKERKFLTDELRKSLEQHSLLSNQIVDLKEQQNLNDLMSLRKLFLLRIVKMNYSFDRMKIMRSFKKWALNNSLMKIANQFKQQMERILIKAKDEMEREKAKALESQKQELTLLKIEELSKLSKEWEETAKSNLEKVMESHEEEKANMVKNHTLAVEELEKDHHFDLDKLQNQFDQMKKEVLLQLQQEREESIKQQQRQISLLKQQFYEKELVEAKETLRAELEEAHNSLLSRKRSEWEEELTLARRNFEIDLDFKLYEQKKEYEKMVEHLHEKHTEDKALWRANEEFLLEKTRKEGEEALARAKEIWRNESLTNLRSELDECRRVLHEEHENHIRKLRELWQQEYDSNLSEAIQNNQEKFQEQLRVGIQEKESEKQSALKQEVKKWKAIVQEQSKTQEMEIQRIILQTKNECEKQFQHERELLLKNIELEKLKEKDIYSLKLQEIQIQFEKEKTELVESETKRFQTEKKEYEIKLKEIFQKDFDEQFALQLLQKTEEFNRLLSLEHRKHESLKEDFSKQMKTFAKERDNLIRQQQSLEKQLEMSETSHQETLKAERILFQGERDKLLTSFDDEKQRLSSLAEKTKTEALLDQKEDLQRRHLSLLQAEKQEMKSQFDSQLSQMQLENERMMKQLESALSELQLEKKHLTDDLAQLTHQLQETEDALFDVKSAKDKLQISKSVLFWQCITKLQMLKLRFQKGIQEFDSEAKKRFQLLQSQLTNQWNDLALQFMKVAGLVAEFDQRRVALLQRFNQAKQQEEMYQSKKNIQLLEYEIDKLLSEKLSLEENKAILLKEIDNLTLEIREQEEMIRQHHAQESAMTIHGRVNIVFARKKRRLDQEIERLLELMETKRNQINEIDDKIVSKVKNREEKELLLIQYEQQFIAVIIQQQKEVYKEVMDWQSFADRTKGISLMIRFPFPPVQIPSQLDVVATIPEITMQDVTNLVERWKQEDSRKEKMNNWKDEEKKA